MRVPRNVTSTTTGARIRALTVEPTGLDLVDRAISRVVDAMRALLAHPRADQTTVIDVSFSAGTNKVVEHRLGRAFRGWNVVRIRTAGSTFREVAQTDAALDSVQVTLVSSATCLADVEVW